MEKCNGLKDLLEAEKPLLEKAILENKWYRSEEAGHDIGMEQATKNFIDNYMFVWAAGYKRCYCNNVCKEDCDLRGKQ